MSRFVARSASDKTDDWPFWFVADTERGGLNVTADLWRGKGVDPGGAVFTPQSYARALAAAANGEPPP